MTSQQFEALCALHATRSPAAQKAAKLVMVDGVPLTEAATRAGVSVQSASNAHTVLQQRLALCQIAAGGRATPE